MSFQAKESLSEQVARHLARDIIQGDLLAGDRIQEQKYAALLEVSRGTVREALLILERWYLIEILPRRGAVVTDLSEGHISALYETAEMLIGVALARTIQKRDDADLDVFISHVHEMQQFADLRELEEFHRFSFDFFTKLASFLNNPFLEQMFFNILPAVERVYFMLLHVDREQVKDLVKFFKVMAESIFQRDKNVAADILEAFIDHQRDLVLESIIRERQMEVALAQRRRK